MPPDAPERTPAVRLGPADAAALAEIEALCFPSSWSAAQFSGQLAEGTCLAFGARLPDGRLAGYVCLSAAGDEAEILNVGVRPELRGRGLATRLLSLALREARERGISKICLDVREGNVPARRLYGRAGFVQAARRRRYYSGTGEDALVMVLSPSRVSNRCEEGVSMKTIIAANWKMNKTRAEAGAVAAALAASLKAEPAAGRDVVVFPSAITLACVTRAAEGAFATGAQNFYPAAKGAYTGENAPAQILETGATWVLCGHSERRHGFGESAEFVGRKVVHALAAGLKPMLCVGETLEEREAGRLTDVLKAQLAAGLAGVAAGAEVAIAYEPVWAIGTGKTAGPAEVVEAHAIVRGIIEFLSPDGKTTPILYGGSVKPSNAGEILALDNVNGVLVGGASLEAESFLKIVRA